MFEIPTRFVLMIFKTPTRIYKFLATTKDRKWIRTKTDDTKPEAVYLVAIPTQINSFR